MHVEIAGGSGVPVVYTYNPRYSGGRDQEDHGLRPAWRKMKVRPMSPYLRNTQHKKSRLPEWLKWKSACLESVSPEFKP
jgi:hypothetical protein